MQNFSLNQQGCMQEVLQKALVILGSEHPYHTLYHLYALKHGNLGPDGRPSAPGTNAGGMLRLIDHSKIAAASTVLDSIRASSHRLTPLAGHNLEFLPGLNSQCRFTFMGQNVLGWVSPFVPPPS